MRIWLEVFGFLSIAFGGALYGWGGSDMFGNAKGAFAAAIASGTFRELGVGLFLAGILSLIVAQFFKKTEVEYHKGRRRKP